MATLEDVERFVAQHQDLCDAGRPASDDLIEAAEGFLQLRFPNDYREFLGRWGWLAIGPLEFYGITGSDFESSSVPNAIWFTHVKRKLLGLPKEMIILYNNNGDEYYCLDASQPGESRVIVWDTVSRESETEKAESLFDFILDEANELI